LKEKISPENSKHEEKMIVDWLIGAFLFTEVRTLQSVGGFSEDYFLYAEDMDLSYKYHERNYKVMFDPSFSIKHLGGTSERQDISEDKSSKLIRAFITFANKYKLSQNITAFKFSYTVKLIVIFPISFLSSKGKVIFNRYKNNLKILNESRNIN
jgi:GT2 family glycosyltransferase